MHREIAAIAAMAAMAAIIRQLDSVFEELK